MEFEKDSQKEDVHGTQRRNVIKESRKAATAQDHEGASGHSDQDMKAREGEIGRHGTAVYIYNQPRATR